MDVSISVLCLELRILSFFCTPYTWPWWISFPSMTESMYSKGIIRSRNITIPYHTIPYHIIPKNRNFSTIKGRKD